MITMDEEDGDPIRFIVSECEADGMIDRRQACMRARLLGHDFLRKFDQMNLEKIMKAKASPPLSP